jgi:hypothetical protein
MTEDSEWSEIPENGITLGPEEALSKEIEKNKTLKVEKLGLQNEIEKLRSENSHLTNKNQELNYRLQQLAPLSPQQLDQTPNYKESFKRFSILLIWIASFSTFVLFIFFLFF